MSRQFFSSANFPKLQNDRFAFFYYRMLGMLGEELQDINFTKLQKKQIYFLLKEKLHNTYENVTFEITNARV